MIQISHLKPQDTRGITLVELIIAASLTTAILAMTFSIYLLGHKIFHISTNQSFAQENARIAAQFIMKDLRNARAISDREDYIVEVATGYYVLTVEEGHFIRQFKKSGSIVSSLKICKVASINFSLDADPLLHISLKTQEKSQTYELDFDIRLLNIESDDMLIEKSPFLYYSTY